jgi:hypothetical protein
MKKFLLALTMLGEAALLPLHAATMASQPWTTNRIAEAEARVNARITSATNAIPAPDYSTGNAQLVATIEATAPAPGDYANVSNRAMSAIQSLEPATNYTDAATNAISSAFLPRQYDDGDDEASVGFDYGPGGLAFVPSELYTTSAYIRNLWIISDDERGPLSAIGQYSGGWKTARDEVEEAIREKSLGGIWDQELGVWWTPVMVNGALRYTATTNVNLSAGGNQ